MLYVFYRCDEIKLRFFILFLKDNFRREIIFLVWDFSRFLISIGIIKDSGGGGLGGEGGVVGELV